MATTITRRPLPALVLLVALLVLAAIVWWRVLSRDSGSHPSASTSHPHTTCPTPAAPTLTLPPASSGTVLVLNSTDRAGIATKARADLIADGFKIPSKAGNDKPTVSIPATAELRYGPAASRTAALLRYYFPGAQLQRLKTNSRQVVVSLGDKYTAVATQAQVKAALAKNRVTVAPGANPTPTGTPTPTGSASTGASASASSSPSC